MLQKFRTKPGVPNFFFYPRAQFVFHPKFMVVIKTSTIHKTSYLITKVVTVPEIMVIFC